MLPSLAAGLLLLAISHQQGVSQELVEIQQRLATAWVTGDRAAIEHIIAPDWTVTGPDGRVSTRADVLRDAFETKVHRITAIEIDDVRVRVFGDTAVVTGRTHGRGQYENTPYDVTIRFTDVFVRREARWQAVASHASLLDQPGKTGKQRGAPRTAEYEGSCILALKELATVNATFGAAS